MRLIVAIVLFWAACEVGVAHAASAERGMFLARTHCARCHSIDKVTPSSLPIAPPFRTLHQRYPVEYLEEALAEGIVTGHPSMPEFRFEPDQISDFIAFLKSLEK
jgi:cytochrome c